MVKVVNLWSLVAAITAGIFNIAASTLPELIIITDTTPPEAITESGATSTLSTTAPVQSSNVGSSSQSVGSNDAGYDNNCNPLVIKGNRFFDSATGDYFAVRGVNYYPRPNTGPLDINNLDLFSDDFKHIWSRDLPQFTALNANVIRLYSVDPDVDHSAFMCALQAEGIYVVVDLGSNCEGCEITADAA
ncbi:hypothetical protein PF008_g30472, partial [Phytophthora fragariae]